jgi:signal transduction histidine kinase
VRCALEALPEDEPTPSEPEAVPKLQAVTEIDPGWVIGQSARGAGFDPLGLIARGRWWTSEIGSARVEVLARHWRHAVAVSQAARRLAREAGDPDPDQVARAGLLHGLGRWAAVAVDPAWMAEWFAHADIDARLAFERESLGIEASSLGRILAERWGCDPLVVDATWLHADRERTLGACAGDPNRLALVQEAYAWAEQTPWALASNGVRDSPTVDPRLRVLIAEVQVRCGGPFVEPDATAHEERLARANARLRQQVAQLRHERDTRGRVLAALADSDPAESPQTWAERAGLCWCGEPGVTAARVVWTGPGGEPRASAPGYRGTGSPVEASTERPPSLILPLTDRGRTCARIELWTAAEAMAMAGSSPATPERDVCLRAWQGWARLVAERVRLAERLEQVVRSHRDRVVSEGPRIAQAKRAALAEFAAGAGHELNNPLAVIVGRAQLLLARTTDAGAIRSLRAILTQAQRAHRILRDLMFFARPPEPRPRFCQPEEIVRHCVRDLKEQAEESGVRLIAEARGPDLKVWADPDALRHVTEALLRNALEATPKNGSVQVTTTIASSSAGAPESLSWQVQDSGRGLSSTEAAHLFDPFYCGRQAGRGVGLGLPRVARIVEQCGGEIRWHPAPGQGTVFHVHLPLAGPPQAPAELASAANSITARKEEPS